MCVLSIFFFPQTSGLGDLELEVEKSSGEFYKNGANPTAENETKNAKTFLIDVPASDLNNTYTLKLKNKSNAILWKKNVKVEPIITPTDGDALPEMAMGSGAVAGIIIAVILIVICAILLIVMWRKKLIGPQPGKHAAGANSTAASTAGALEHAGNPDVEQGYATADGLDDSGDPDGKGFDNPAGPGNGYGNGYPPAVIQPQPDNQANYYSPVMRATPDLSGGGVPEDDVGMEGETDVENNVQGGVKEADRLSDDSGLAERNGNHLPPDTAV